MRIILAAVLACALYGCGRGPYWENTLPPGPVQGVVEIADPVGVCHSSRAVLGCYDRTTGYIWLQSGMDPVMHLCVLRHEYRHAAGDMHPKFDNDTAYGVECGDGTIVPGAVV